MKPSPDDLYIPQKNLFTDIMTSSADTSTLKSKLPAQTTMCPAFMTMPQVPQTVTLKILALSL